MAKVEQQIVDQYPWFHQIDFGDGIVTNGKAKLPLLAVQADAYFANDLVRGRTFLDVGCWDGFNSLEAHRRGASQVLATDHFTWSDEGWGDRRAFDLVRTHLAPEIEVADIDVPQLTMDRVGQFDIVLFAGVFYHLRHPFAALEQISQLVVHCLIVETHLDAMDIPRPAMIFYPTNELANDPTNWWGPNSACVEAMLRDVGFVEVVFTPNPIYPKRGIFHAFK